MRPHTRLYDPSVGNVAESQDSLVVVILLQERTPESVISCQSSGQGVLMSEKSRLTTCRHPGPPQGCVKSSTASAVDFASSRQVWTCHRSARLCSLCSSRHVSTSLDWANNSEQAVSRTVTSSSRESKPHFRVCTSSWMELTFQFS